jgi:hypothetical protein
MLCFACVSAERQRSFKRGTEKQTNRGQYKRSSYAQRRRDGRPSSRPLAWTAQSPPEPGRESPCPRGARMARDEGGASQTQAVLHPLLLRRSGSPPAHEIKMRRKKTPVCLSILGWDFSAERTLLPACMIGRQKDPRTKRSLTQIADPNPIKMFVTVAALFVLAVGARGIPTRPFGDSMGGSCCFAKVVRIGSTQPLG